jgi:hypothetical protein
VQFNSCLSCRSAARLSSSISVSQSLRWTNISVLNYARFGSNLSIRDF